jgi:LacI family transcriptional regulator
MALGVIQAAAELGLRVPADLAVAGFDDIEIAAHLANQLMTVAQKRTEMGRLAAEGILQIIRDPQRFAREPLQRVLAPTLVIRRTCGAVQTTRGQTPQG